MSGGKPDLLIINPVVPDARARFGEIATVHDGLDPASRAEILTRHGADIRAVLTIGTIGLRADEIARMPNLEMISCMGVGYENVDLEAARARGLVVTNGHGTNANAVADHALALLLAVVRGVVDGDRAVRRGEWRNAASARPEVSGMRLGVLGLGMIGEAIAKRCAGGFGMSVAYHNRNPRPGTSHAYCRSLRELAERSDILMVAAPGGAETHHAVDRAVLDALGPDGFLVNIARGSIVDTAALVAALNEGRIAGAALDVIEGEPAVPPEVLAAPGIVMTPHIAGRSPASQTAMVEHAYENFHAHFSGREVKTRIA